MKEITLSWRQEKKACAEAVEEFEAFFGIKADTKKVLERIRDLEKPNWEGWLLGQDIELVKYLVENNADIHAYEDLAVRWAAGNGHLEIVKYLLEIGADIHVYDDLAVRWAAENGHLEVVKYLVKNGADIHARDDLAFQWAAERGHLEVVNYLKSLP